MSDLDELIAAAKAALSHQRQPELARFSAAATPQVILGLAQELYAARAVVSDARNARGGALLASSLEWYDSAIAASQPGNAV